jgi:acetoin utilization protein AcuC
MFGGTYQLVQSLVAGDIKVGFNPQGAKHHAMQSHSSGFCVFNDFAWAARELKAQGFRPLYLDWDIHAGDGVQEMLADTDIPTISIHNGTIFPSSSPTRDRAKVGQRHFFHNPDQHWYNINLTSTDGDEGFAWAMDAATEIIDEYQPDVILLAAGADSAGFDSAAGASSVLRALEGFLASAGASVAGTAVTRRDFFASGFWISSISNNSFLICNQFHV